MSGNLITYKPRVLVIGIDDIIKTKTSEKKHIELTYIYNLESWMHLFEADYVVYQKISETMISRYDIIICTSLVLLDEHYSARVSHIASAKLRHVKWVTVFEGMIDIYHNTLKHLKRMLDSSDLVNVINRSTLAPISSITESKCESLGYPFPIMNISRFRSEIAIREKMLFICNPLLNAASEVRIAANLNIPTIGFEQKVAKGLIPKFRSIKRYREELNELEGRVPGTISSLFSRNKFIDLARARYQLSNLVINPDLAPEKHFRLYSRYFVWISTSPLANNDANVLYAASLGIPIITTKSSNLGAELFPYTCISNEKAYDEAGEIISNLLNDKSYYKQICNFPASMVEPFRGVNQKVRMLKLLNYRA